MKKIALFSLLLIGISSLLLSCATTSLRSDDQRGLEKYNHTISSIGIYPDASIVGGSSYDLLQQLELYYSQIVDDTSSLDYDKNGVRIRVDSLGNIIGTMSSDILFDFDKHELRPTEYSVIDALLSQLTSDAIGKGINIVGHTDSIGTEQYNLILSQKRANAVRDYILTKYQSSIKINATFGLGESQPIVSNETPEARQLNRRVEIIIEK